MNTTISIAEIPVPRFRHYLRQTGKHASVESATYGLAHVLSTPTADLFPGGTVEVGLVEANRLLMPIEHVTGWLFRVARNRITDLFRKKRPESFGEAAVEDGEGELLFLEDLLPSPDTGPDALYARNVLLAELELALD